MLRIAEAMARLPADATLKDAEQAIAAVSDFGNRRTGDGTSWPYKVWLSERKRALEPYRRREEAKAAKPDVRFSVASNETVPASRRWWLDVLCLPCRTRNSTYPGLKGGCLFCCGWHERLDAVVHRPEWAAFRKAMCDDRSVAPIAADWLEEAGLPEVAEVLRRDWDRVGLCEPAVEYKAPAERPADDTDWVDEFPHEVSP